VSAAAHLRTLARLAARSLGSRGEAPPPFTAPRRRVAVEWRGELRAEWVAAYLRATDGERIPAFRGEGAVAPPTYCATWEATSALDLLAQTEIPLSLGGVIHLESEIFPLRPHRLGERVRARMELERAEATPRGVRLTVKSRSWNGAEQLCSEGSSLFLVRAPDSGGPRPPREAAEEEPGWEELTRWALPGGAGRRYARASGDYNPIHLWGWTARPFGFRRPILHGFCTRALVAHALIERRLGGDPAALRRLRIAFRAPLLLPARVRLLLREEGGARTFRVMGEGDPSLHAEGSFVGA
jgi:acyl dehydratase